MVGMSVGIFFAIFFAVILFNIIVLMAFRRKGVSVLDGLFKFYFKHGFFWFYRQPQLYFKDSYAKLVRLTGIAGLSTFLIILLFLLTSCAPANSTDILVTKVFDGDTIRLANGEKVRLLGIDTPEMYESDKLYRDARRTGENIETIMAKGRKSYKFTRELVEGRRVMLEFDVEKRDKYGRLLAHVFIADTQLFLNAEILKEGYAEPMVIPPNLKYADYFQELYQEARENKRGLWSIQ